MGNFMRNEPLDGSGERGNEFVDEIFFFPSRCLLTRSRRTRGRRRARRVSKLYNETQLLAAAAAAILPD